MQRVRTTTGTLLREGGREKHCSQKEALPPGETEV